jgi:hypothetical protein
MTSRRNHYRQRPLTDTMLTFRSIAINICTNCCIYVCHLILKTVVVLKSTNQLVVVTETDCVL